MGRHKKSIERPIMPDVKYNSKVVSKFVCRMMLDGKKSICTKIIYEAMDNLKAKTDKDLAVSKSLQYRKKKITKPICIVEAGVILKTIFIMRQQHFINYTSGRGHPCYY